MFDEEHLHEVLRLVVGAEGVAADEQRGQRDQQHEHSSTQDQKHTLHGQRG